MSTQGSRHHLPRVAFRKYAQAHLTGPEPGPAEPADS
jgi:hypothetical protein